MTQLGEGLIRIARRLAFGLAATATVAAFVVPDAFASPESDAADAINQAWQAAGGSDSAVGGMEGDVYEVGSGFGQKFAEGKIFFSTDSGAHLIYGAILDKYESLGGPADSDLGFPNINEVAGLVGSDSRVSTFTASDKPAIFWTPDTGAWAVRGAINVAWDKLGGSAGTLGVPTEDERYNGDVVSQKFTGGDLSWNTASKTFTSEPAGLADNLVGLEVPLDPTTVINQAWRAAGGLGGPLGARQGDQTPIGEKGAAQGYAGGKIFYSPETGAHAVTGAILSKYESVGGPTGDLGYPIGTESEGGAPNSRVSAFSAPDKPVIFWTPDSGAIVVRGAINAAWDKLGGAAGSLGVPTSEQKVNGDNVTQTFSGGEISWNSATKEFSTKPADLVSNLSGLELPDGVGQTPADSSGSTSKDGSGWHWWWLAIILPLLALLGLLAVWAQRRGQREDDYYVADVDEDQWRAETAEVSGRQRYDAAESGRSWSAPAEDDSYGDSYGGDEDAIDTAPTRVLTHHNIDEQAEVESPAAESRRWLDELEAGRHSASLSDTASAWRFDLDDADRPRHRRAADDSPSWWADIKQDIHEEIQRREPDYDFEADRGIVEDVEVEIAPVIAPVNVPQAPARDLFAAPAARETYEKLPVEDEPWRPAIHLPLADPYQAPEGYFIKANTHSGLFYTPDSVLYDNTLPEVWFATEDLAEANGFVKAPD